MFSFFDLLNSIEEGASENLHPLRDKIVLQSVKKGTLLQSPGESHIRAYYVKKGLLRSYTIDNKGKEHIFIFAPEGWLVSDLPSLNPDRKTELFVDALEDSEIELIDESFILHLSQASEGHFQHQFERLIKRIGVLQRRIIMLMSATALERYQDFVKTYPQIVQRVPQRMIASYLGITPEALSKLKNQDLKKSNVL